MDEFEKNLRQALAGRGQYDAHKSDDVRKEALRMYDDKLRTYRWVTWGILAFETLVMIVLIGVFALMNDTKVLIALAALALASYETTILMKLWYWNMNVKMSTLKELKGLQLQIAELSQKIGQGQGDRGGR